MTERSVVVLDILVIRDELVDTYLVELIHDLYIPWLWIQPVALWRWNESIEAS